MPIRFAPAVMSLFGLALAWRALSDLGGWESGFGRLISIGALLLGLVTFGSIVLHQFRKGALRETFENPQLRVLPACLTVGLMLLSALLAPHMPRLANAMIWIAALGHFLLLAWLINGWFRGGLALEIISPVWFIPVVGNIVVPVGAIASGEVMLAWFGFSVGIVLWLMLLPIVFFRLIHGKPMPDELESTQMVLVAPPAIGSVSWSLLAGDQAVVPGVVLLSVAFFLMLTMVPMVLRVISRPFVPANWAFGFPLAALSTGLATYSILLERDILMGVGLVILLLVSALILWALIGSARVLVKS
jgi:tellurite resistance protein